MPLLWASLEFLLWVGLSLWAWLELWVLDLAWLSVSLLHWSLSLCSSPCVSPLLFSFLPVFAFLATGFASFKAVFFFIGLLAFFIFLAITFQFSSGKNSQK